MRLKLSPLNAAFFGLGLAALGASCSAMAQNTTYPAGYGVQAYTPKDFHLPEGAGCSGDVARWQAVQANDYASGNVNLKIYNQIQNEIARAAEVCAAGRDGEARKLVASSKARHGYPQ